MYKLQCIPKHPIHRELKHAKNKFKEAVDKTKTEHWIEWLENISLQDAYIVNKYVSGKPTDYSYTRILSLTTLNINSTKTMANSNKDKCMVLAESFFPPLSTTSAIPMNCNYPPPLPGINFFSHDCIGQASRLLHLYKAPSPDGIPNVLCGLQVQYLPPQMAHLNNPCPLQTQQTSI